MPRHDGTQGCLDGEDLLHRQRPYYLRVLARVRGVGTNVWTRKFHTGAELYLDWPFKGRSQSL